jgi:hypothetical protein
VADVFLARLAVRGAWCRCVYRFGVGFGVGRLGQLFGKALRADHRHALDQLTAATSAGITALEEPRDALRVRAERAARPTGIRPSRTSTNWDAGHGFELVS